MRGHSLIFVSAALVAAAAPAVAGAREKIALASFKVVGPTLTDPERQKQLRTSLIGGLEAADFEVVPQGQVDSALVGSAGLVGCDTTTCLHRVAELVGVRRVVRATMETTGSNWQLTLELIDTADASCAARVETPCQVCNDRETDEKLSNAGAELRAKLPLGQPPPITTTTSMRPPPNFQPGLTAPPPDRPRPWRGVGAAAVALGSVAVLTGVVLILVNNDETGRHTDAFGHLFIDRLSTLGGGIAATAGGALVIACGIGALWHDSRMQRQVTLAPQVAPGRAGLILDARF